MSSTEKMKVSAAPISQTFNEPNFLSLHKVNFVRNM